MAPEPASLLRLAESIADGAAVDWETVETDAAADEQAVVRQLRVLADLALLHRSLAGDRPAATPAAPPRGRTWAHLELLDLLGTGTFGEVYRGWDPALEREVAVKLLRADAGVEESTSSRIAFEGRLLAKIRHPNVITVYGVAVHDGRVGLWMELVRGATLEQLLAARGPLSAREAALVGIDLCRALAAIHAAGLVHRDVKAQNVMREEGGRIVLMDLGTGQEIAAEPGRAGARLAGTPVYLAPEVLEGAPADAATDVYSLGVLLYRLVTGSFPVRATTIDDLRRAHAAGRGVRLRDARADLPTAFVRVIDRAIAIPRSRRYATPGELEADLLQALEAPHSHPAVAPPPVAGHRVTRRLLGLAAALAVLAVAAVWWLLSGTPERPATPGPVRSLAVLPLANLSGDASQNYLADGFTEELIATLGRLGGLRVISRTSVTPLANSGQLLPEIARQLNVDAILEGSVRLVPAGPAPGPDDRTRVRVTARLIHAGTDTQLWSRTFERLWTEALALQIEVADAVARAIDLEPAPYVLQAAGQASPGGEAQQAYLEGRALMGRPERDGMVRARAAFERAVALEPAFARAHAALSVCYVYLELMGMLPRAEAAARATAAAARALELDPNLPEAHGALADVRLVYEWNWDAAGESYRRALALNPSYTFARRQYAWYLVALGRADEALQHAKQAESADPLSPDARSAVGMVLYFNRQYDAAVAQMRRSLALGVERPQEHNGLARALAATGAYAEAVREMEQALRLSGDTPAYVAELARTHAAAGEAARARALLARLNQSAAAGTRVSPYAYAFVHAALGDRDRAFQYLDESLRERMSSMLWVRVDPRLDPLRGDARFAALVASVGLPPGR